MLWVVGDVIGDENNRLVSWSIAGIFDDEGVAVSHCEHRLMFVAPIALNQAVEGEREQDWPGLYYPIGDAE